MALAAIGVHPLQSVVNTGYEVSKLQLVKIPHYEESLLYHLSMTLPLTCCREHIDLATRCIYNGVSRTQVICTLNGGRIQLGRNLYDIYGNPHLYNISLVTFITLYKCPKLPNDVAEMEAYFDQSNYNKKRCGDYNFYYNHSISDKAVPSDLPPACQVIQLPVNVGERSNGNETNIFSLLSSVVSIYFVTPCNKCQKEEGRCYTLNGHFQYCKNETTLRKLKYILVPVGSAFVIIIFFVIFIIWHRYKSHRFSYFSSKEKSPNVEDASLFYGVSVFSCTELEDATKNFNPSKELGNGGFGAVYYGKLQDGREVAVKRLYEHNYKRVQQFVNEVQILTGLRHPNLVVLYGCTSRQSHELLLVYEYITNGTVADHLHGEIANPSFLTWPLRMNIAIETARALVYLHASEIIHRDVKTSNILLDHNFSAKVADFGLSRLLPNDVTHVSTAPQGTPGYLDPQYHNRYQLTEKSDVYSFGVVLIELISSMRAVDLNRSEDEISLANLALNKIQRCALDQLIDPDLGSDSDAETMRMITSVAELAFQCLQYYSEMRPTMNEVLEALKVIQSQGGIDSDDSISDMEKAKPPPPSAASDKTVVLKDFLPSPVSITSEWHSASTASTTLTVK
ncbi:unnamed protein product [Lactuca saligna]|uniref:Protein kinase domain-containing protein n=1 Tax=Lactuca saligna TaxID=75948 RepID=A0AA36DYS8_LACSI|nr:unnamed protein product [Lactuca saligna]